MIDDDDVRRVRAVLTIALYLVALIAIGLTADACRTRIEVHRLEERVELLEQR